MISEYVFLIAAILAPIYIAWLAYQRWRDRRAWGRVGTQLARQHIRMYLNRTTEK